MRTSKYPLALRCWPFYESLEDLDPGSEKFPEILESWLAANGASPESHLQAVRAHLRAAGIPRLKAYFGVSHKETSTPEIQSLEIIPMVEGKPVLPTDDFFLAADILLHLHLPGWAESEQLEGEIYWNVRDPDLDSLRIEYTRTGITGTSLKIPKTPTKDILRIRVPAGFLPEPADENSDLPVPAREFLREENLEPDWLSESSREAMNLILRFQHDWAACLCVLSWHSGKEPLCLKEEFRKISMTGNPLLPKIWGQGKETKTLLESAWIRKQENSLHELGVHPGFRQGHSPRDRWNFLDRESETSRRFPVLVFFHSLAAAPWPIPDSLFDPSNLQDDPNPPLFWAVKRIQEDLPKLREILRKMQDEIS